MTKQNTFKTVQQSKEAALWAVIDQLDSTKEIKKSKELELLAQYGIGVKKITKSETALDRKSYLVALGLTDAAAEAYIERLAVHSDDVFLSIVGEVAASIKTQQAQAAVDKTTNILKAKYGNK